ncbi:MAG: helix-turn-helix transcriptional regulator [Ectothiorhodospiraceae bacterium]|nr:helix-turn-helix transcriptional regulator [Ectothiorhodospiraceae bacterium]
MKSYGQYCPLAIASEVLGERWTLLVLRELILGSTRFNAIHRGVPRMSPSLLSTRLKMLERAGIIRREPRGDHVAYRLTDAGAALAPAVESLAVWSREWLPATLSEARADPDLVMWDMHRRMDSEKLPAARTVIRFEFDDQPEIKRLRWIIADRSDVELCITDPGFDVDLYVTASSRTVTLIWYGDLPLNQAIRQGLIRLHGPPALCTAFPSWLRLNLLAGIPRKRPVPPLTAG